MNEEKRALFIETVKDTIWWIAVVITLLAVKLIFDNISWEAVYTTLLAAPFIFLIQYRVNKKKIPPKRQTIEWVIVVGVIALFALIIYLKFR